MYKKKSIVLFLVFGPASPDECVRPRGSGSLFRLVLWAPGPGKNMLHDFEKTGGKTNLFN